MSSTARMQTAQRGSTFLSVTLNHPFSDIENQSCLKNEWIGPGRDVV